MGVLSRPEEVLPLVKLRVAAGRIKRQIPPEEHWAFAYTMLQRVSRSFALVIQQLGPDLRNAVSIHHLFLLLPLLPSAVPEFSCVFTVSRARGDSDGRCADSAEDDTSIPAAVKVPILKEFHRHIYNRDWHYSCGTKDYKLLMDKFRLVSTAFLELGQGYQEAIEEITRLMGAGMAKFICKEFHVQFLAVLSVETVDDYNEYCHYVAGLVGYGLSRLFHAGGTEDLASDSLSNSMGLFLQDLKYEENSEKAVQCLNDMVTNALSHAEDCLQYMSALKDHAIFRFCAIPQIMAIGTCAICYNNVNVFRGVVKMRRGLTARVIDETNTMSDVYTAFYEFSSLIESKIDNNDPNASLTRKRVDAIKRTCKSSCSLKRRGYDLEKSKYNSMLIMVVLLLVAIVLGMIYAK
uniref:Uncharacterized protein n=2 Tax=Oryza TaxID=4527 RepID=A0A0E0P2S3_ORYRU